MTAFTALLHNDVRLFFANRRAVIMSIVAPIAISAFFGSLFGNHADAPARINIAVVDLDHSGTSAKIVAALAAERSLAVSQVSAASAAARLHDGALTAVVTLPAEFGRHAAAAFSTTSGAKPTVVLDYDPSKASAVQVVRGLLAGQVTQTVAQAAFSDAGDGPATTGTGTGDAAPPTTSASGAAASTGFTLPYTLRETPATASTGPEYNSYAHSFAGMGVQFVLLMGIDLGLGLLLTRRMDLWKRLRAAPITKATLLGSRVASGAAIAVIVLTVIYAVAMAAFGVRVEGSWLGFIGVIVAFALFAASLGLLVAAIGRTPEATRGLAILVVLLMVMLGGAWVPAFIFPAWLQQVSLCVPTRWAVDGLDAMTWRGLGLRAAWAPIGVLLLSAAACLGIAVARFRWEE